MESDVKLLTNYANLNPQEVFGNNKWPGARPKIDRQKQWEEIEKDKGTMTQASQNVILKIIGAKENEVGKKVFSDPYFNLEAIYVISTIGNGFSIDPKELTEFRRRCNLAAARTKSEKEFEFLTAFYGLVLRGDQEARKQGR